MMLPLYLLAAHLVGDFVFQTRWQAEGKFGWTADAHALRCRHVLAYATAFLPIVVWRCWNGPPWWHGVGFLDWLIFLHWLTDSRRFTSTLGDVVGWRFHPQRPSHKDLDGAWETVNRTEITYFGARGTDVREALRHREEAQACFDELKQLRSALVPEANPWPSVGLVIDQTLHVVQVAVLAGIFL